MWQVGCHVIDHPVENLVALTFTYMESELHPETGSPADSRLGAVQTIERHLVTKAEFAGIEALPGPEQQLDLIRDMGREISKDRVHWNTEHTGRSDGAGILQRFKQNLYATDDEIQRISGLSFFQPPDFSETNADLQTAYEINLYRLLAEKYGSNEGLDVGRIYDDLYHRPVSRCDMSDLSIISSGVEDLIETNEFRPSPDMVVQTVTRLANLKVSVSGGDQKAEATVPVHTSRIIVTPKRYIAHDLYFHAGAIAEKKAFKQQITKESAFNVGFGLGPLVGVKGKNEVKEGDPVHEKKEKASDPSVSVITGVSFSAGLISKKSRLTEQASERAIVKNYLKEERVTKIDL